jgi:sulfate adenylyltransferase
MREMINNGEAPSEFILRPEVAKLIIEYDKPFVE